MADLGKLDLKKSLGVYSKNMIIDLRWFSGGNGCYLEFLIALVQYVKRAGN